MEDGKVVTDRKATAGPVASLRKMVLFEHADMVFLRYDAVDEKDVHVISCDAPVEISVTGGELLGADNGSTVDHTSFTASRRSLYRGSIVVIARRTSGAFKVAVRFVGLAPNGK
jgi:beta-galactosidase